MKHLSRTLLAAALMAGASASHALTFNFTFVSGTSAQAQQAFIDAGARWSSLFADPVTVNLTVGQQSLGSGILASAGSNFVSVPYSSFRSSLTADATSGNDTIATANLPAGSAFNVLINRTSDNPNGSGSATPYLDTAGANNQTIRITNANAKAIGVAPTNTAVGACTSACDGSIVFGTAFTWDYNPNDGIAAGAFDFVGIATHEIGHALGFISGVDVLDINSPPVNGPFTANQFTFVNSLDLFRYSTQSNGLRAIDFTADTRAKYFSIDGGTTNLGPTFSTGSNFGDGRQASHWKDSLGIGIMDPTFAPGELGVISSNDILAFDVIGYTLVPEPGTYALFGLGLATLMWRKRRAQAA